jgi:putative hydrolase of the HAD superfamily
LAGGAHLSQGLAPSSDQASWHFTYFRGIQRSLEPIHSEAFLEKLSKNYRLALLSNTDPIHMSHEEARFPFFRFFPIRIYSYQVGASKPDPIIYRQALHSCEVGAEEAIYIDDVAAYAEAALRLGLTGIVFQSPEQLQTDLRGLGIQFD